MVVQKTSQTELQSAQPDVPKTVSDRIVEYLEQLEVDYVFGIPGGHNSSLFEALARSERRGGTRAILTCHETGAVYMADGYARETGKIGVCCTTTGPGTTNLITGVASAYAESIPLLVITAQTMVSHFGWGAFQESSPDTIDTVSMLAHCTRYNSLVTHPNQLERKLTAALTTAWRTSPQGPAHLSIPVDILRSQAPEAIARPNLQQFTQPSALVDLAALDALYQALFEVLSQGQQVVLLIGQACTGAAPEIVALAELIGAAIITDQGGKSCIDPYHPLARGVFGFAGHPTARQALTDETVGLILAAGTPLDHWATSQWDRAVLNHKLIHIHPASSHFARSPMARLQVQGNIKTIFQELVTRLKTSQNNQTLHQNASSFKTQPNATYPLIPSQIQVQDPNSYHYFEDDESIRPQQLIVALLQNFPPETRYLVDIGNWLAWTIHYLFPPRPENYRLSVGTAPMGWGIGSAIGTALGTRNTPVVCLTGDGCFLMHGSELAVAVSEQLPIVFVILNDQSYGMVKHRHRQTGTEPLQFTLPAVDFSLMAKAMGANGYKINSPQELQQLDYQAIFSYPGPTVLDVRIDPEQIPPLKMC